MYICIYICTHVYVRPVAYLSPAGLWYICLQPSCGIFASSCPVAYLSPADLWHTCLLPRPLFGLLAPLAPAIAAAMYMHDFCGLSTFCASSCAASIPTCVSSRGPTNMPNHTCPTSKPFTRIANLHPNSQPLHPN